MKQILSVIIFFGVLVAHAQNTPELNTKLIPPSPDVAAMEKYGIQPVTLYSGMTNVSVPVYNIQTTNLSLPVSFGYNYNGYKPGEEASVVGLGWSLQAGGVITRMIKGKADENYLLHHKWQDYANILDLKENPDFLAAVALGYEDTEPDIYIFNFGGYSGKFILVGDRAFLFPKQNITIRRYSAGAGFFAYTPDGRTYDFHDIETTHPTNSQNNFTPDYTSAWNLSRIISMDWSEEITFQYEGCYHGVGSGTYSETYTQQNGGGVNCTIGTCDTWTPTIFHGAVIDSKRLKSITSKTVVINFIADPLQRQDLLNNQSAHALKEIEIFSMPESTLVKKIALTHSYFDVVNHSCLKLDEVQVTGYRTVNLGGTVVQQSLPEPAYTFEYNHEDDYYPKTTKGIDRWGYYNGRFNNYSLFDYTLTGGMLSVPFGDRNVYTDYCSYGILNKITYPTGGYSTFEYENNLVRMPGANVNILENKFSSLTQLHSGGYNEIQDSSYSSNTFNIDVTQNINVHYRRSIDTIPLKNWHHIFKLFRLNFDQNGDPVLPPTPVYVSPYIYLDSYEDSVMLNLTPGSYMYQVTCDGKAISSTAEFNYTITHFYAYQGDNGPGMRIKSIDSYDNIDNTTPVMNRSYTYGNGATLIHGPGYGSNVVHHRYDCGDYDEYIYTSDMSTPIATLDADQFYYPVVTEINNDSAVTGKSVYEYHAYGDAIGVKLGTQTDYTARGTGFDKVKVKRNTYSDYDYGQPVLNFWGFTTNVSTVLEDPHCTFGIPLLSGSLFDTIGRRTLYGTTQYALSSYNNYLVSTEETTYAANETNPLTVLTNYSYDNPDYSSPTKTVVNNSKGETITTQVNYPLDYNFSNYPPLSAIDATFNNSRLSAHNAYISCTISRYAPALHEYRAGIPNYQNGPLLEVLRAWKCEDHYPVNYAPVVTTLNSDFYTLYSCYDPSLYSPAEKAAIVALQQNHLQVPVEQIVSITKPGGEYLQSAVKTDYSYSFNTTTHRYRSYPKKLFQTTFSNTPLLKSTFMTNPGSYYQPRVDFTYDNYGNIIQQSKINDIKEAYVWDYGNQHAIAKVLNAEAADVSATSFEADGQGGFNFASGGATVDNNAITGKKTYSFSYGSISRFNLNTTKTYVVSYWADNAKSVNGTAPLATGRSLNGLTYYEHTIANPSSGNIIISGSGKIDELRLYPVKALMSTYTYDQEVGITTECDANNKINYYIYDALGRLRIVKDQDNFIVKKVCYNYAGQTVDCAGQAVYHNVQLSQTFTRNNCPSGLYGTPVTITVAANTYTSYISQFDADQQAQNYLNTHGQSDANSQGNCIGISPSCNSGNCNGANKKCINGVCDTGIKVYTSAEQNKDGSWTCFFHYEFSDGSWSATYSEQSSGNCMD